MYQNLKKNGRGGFENDGYYWSSSQYDYTSYPWLQDYGNGIYSKNYERSVRAVRAF